MSITRAGKAIVAAIVWVSVLQAGSALAAALTWNTGSGTWDDTTAANWTPAQVPVDEDSVTINRGTNTTVDFASAYFAGANSNLTGLTLGGTGASNILQIGAGDMLRYSNSITINSGGMLDISGGTVTDATASAFWHNGLVINNGGQARITGGTFIIPLQSHVNLADTAGHTASLEVSGSGVLSNSAASGTGSDFNSKAGNSTLTLSGNGAIQMRRDILVGTTGGNHLWTISGGDLRSMSANGTSTGFKIGGGNGTATVNQTAGNIYSAGYINLSTGGTYNISGGNCTNGTLYVNGTINQTGGNFYNLYDTVVGSQATGTGVLSITSGSFRSRGFNIARTPDSCGIVTLSGGTFSMNNNNSGVEAHFEIGANSGAGSGTLVLKGVTVGTSVTASSGMVVNATGVIRGYGTISVGAALAVLAGRVIADGEGIDRTLDLSSLGATSNFTDNVTNKGWFAVNHGKLLLPKVSINAATTNVYNLGESPEDTTIDLVNSARLEFTGLTGSSGSLTGAVYAVDRPEAYAANGWKVSVHEFITNGIAASKCALTIRYDDSAAMGRDAQIVMHRWNGSTWDMVPSTVDVANHWITATNLTSLGRFTLSIHNPSGSIDMLQ